MSIGRTRFKKEIITEFVAPSNKKSKKVMIFCSGVPSVPCKDDVLEFWAKKGFWTFFPRYRGTWESKGTFLAQSLEYDIFDVIDSLNEPFKDFWSGLNFKVNAQSVTVIGSSFGGPAAILASMDERVDKAICLSPVVDWTAENKSEPLEELYSFLRLAYGKSYRLNKNQWNKLSRGNFYNPVHHIKEIDGSKIMIFHAQNDDIVKIKPVIKFAKKTKAHMVVFKTGGHLSSSILTKKNHSNKVTRFIQ